MNKGTIRTRIRAFLKDNSTDESLQRWSSTVLNNDIQEIQEEMVSLTGMLITRITCAVTAGTNEYTLPTTFLGEKQVLFLDSNGTFNRLEKTNERELDLFSVGWRDTSVTSDPVSQYYTRRDKIGLYPIPSVSRASALRIDFVRRPDEMDDDSDVPFNGEYKWYMAHMGIVYGVCRLCMMDEGKWGESDKFEEKYAYSIKEILREMTRDNVDSRIINIYETVRHQPRRTR